jgi:formylglycine-generating enzyme required for sulfatase activity
MRGPRPDEVPAAVAIAPTTYEFGFHGDVVLQQVEVRGFSIAKTPITVKNYKQCIEAGVCTTPASADAACSEQNTTRPLFGPTFDIDAGGHLPITCATPQQAAGFCAWQRASLPSVTEWLLAARGPRVEAYPWAGGGQPTCEMHPDAWRLDPSGQTAGAPCAADQDARSFYAVGQRPLGGSPSGLLDVLVTPAELVRSTTDSPTAACASDEACAIVAISPGSIDRAVRLTGDYTMRLAQVGSFRCVWH